MTCAICQCFPGLCAKAGGHADPASVLWGILFEVGAAFDCEMPDELKHSTIKLFGFPAYPTRGVPTRREWVQ